jgi:hypothetical protein
MSKLDPAEFLASILEKLEPPLLDLNTPKLLRPNQPAESYPKPTAIMISELPPLFLTTTSLIMMKEHQE